MRLVREFISEYKLRFTVAGVVAVAGYAVYGFAAMATRDLVNMVMHHAPLGGVVGAALLVLGLEVLAQLLFFVGESLAHVIEYVVPGWMLGRILGRLLAANELFFSRLSPGDILSRLLSDVEYVSIAVTALLGFVVYGVSLCIGVASLASISLLLTIVALAVLAPLVPALGRVSGGVSEKAGREREAFSEVVEAVRAGLEGHVEVRAYGVKGYVERVLGSRLRRWMRAASSLAWAEVFSWRMSSVYHDLSAVLVLVAGLAMSSMGLVDVAGVVAVFSHLGLLYVPLRRICEVWVMYRKGISVLERIGELLALAESHAVAVRGSRPVPEELSSLEVEGLRISVEGRTIVDGASFSVRGGEWVGLVGASGVGKTLLALALAGLVPFEGSVRIDGVDILEYDVEERLRRIVYVPPRPMVLAGTLEENIRLGDTSIGEDAIEEALRTAGVDFASRESMVHPDKLSEGQRQRIGLARALARRPALLILDEATSSLDPRLEREVFSRMRERYPELTVIVITHRPATLQQLDRILVLHGGKIVCEGKHEQLLRTCSVYGMLLTGRPRQQLFRP